MEVGRRSGLAMWVFCPHRSCPLATLGPGGRAPSWATHGLGCPGPGPGAATASSADEEKLVGVTEGHGVGAMLSTQRAEDSSESHEEEQEVSGGQCRECLGPAWAELRLGSWESVQERSPESW